MLTAAIYLFNVLYAFTFAMIAPFMGSLIERYGLTLSEGGLIASAQNLGGLLAALAGSFFADRFPKTRQLGVVFAIYGLSMLSLFFEPSFAGLLAVFFVMGASTRLVDTVSNALVSDLHQGRRALFLNLLHTFFAAGVLVGPLFARCVVAGGLPWHAGFGLLGVMCMLTLLPYWPLAARGETRLSAKGRQTAAPPWPVMKSGQIRLLCLMMIFYVGHQVSYSLWLPLYMERTLGSPADAGSAALAFFWLGILVGRLTAPFVLKRLSPAVSIIGGSFIGAMCMTMGLLSGGVFGLSLGGCLAGFSAATIVPYLVTLGSGWFPDNSGAVSSLLFLSSSVSRMILPYLIGLTAEKFGFFAGMMLQTASLAAVGAIMLVMRYTRGLHGSSDFEDQLSAAG